MSAYDDAHRIAVLQQKRDEIDAEIAELKDKFRDTQTQVYTDDSAAGRVAIIVKVTPNKRIDDKLAQEHLTIDVYTQVSKRVIDTAKARAFLTADEIDKITRVYDNKVEVQVQ